MDGKAKSKQSKRVIISSLLICLVIGIAYCWSVFEKELVQSYGWTNAQASLPYSTFMLAYAIMMLLGGKLQRQLGMKRTCIAGALTLTTGLIVSTVFPTVAGITLGFGALTGAGQAMCYSCVISTPLKWCSSKKRGLISGLTTGAVGLTSIYMTPIITAVISTQNIRFGFLTMLAIVAPVLLLFSYQVDTPKEQSAATQNSGRLALCTMLRQKALYQIFFLSFSCSLYGQIIVGHVANIAYVQAGIENGHFLVLLLSFSNCAGRFLCGVLSDYVAGPKLMRIVYGVGAVNILLFAFYSNAPMLILGTLLIGFGYGASHSVIPTMISGCFGTKHFSSYFGLTSLAAGIAGVCGPLLAGYVMDINGSYTFAYFTSAVCLLLAALVSGRIQLFSKGTAI